MRIQLTSYRNDLGMAMTTAALAANHAHLLRANRKATPVVATTAAPYRIGTSERRPPPPVFVT